jgi:hypothetical protein
MYALGQKQTVLNQTAIVLSQSSVPIHLGSRMVWRMV